MDILQFLLFVPLAIDSCDYSMQTWTLALHCTTAPDFDSRPGRAVSEDRIWAAGY
jgi:hypothetical protein